MAANDVQIRFKADDFASKIMQDVSRSADRTAASINSLGNTARGFVFNAAGIAAGIAGFNGLSAAVQGAADATINFSRSMETNEIGIAGILTSMTEVNGRNLQWNEAMGISKQVMAQLNDEALKTAATSEEMVTTFRGILGPALSAKMSMSEIVQLTSTGVNAVKSLGLNNTQLVQELRDLVQGGIQPASSTLATALGLKDSDIKAAKASSEGLFKFLMDRLEGFKIASEYTQNTFTGKLDQIKEGFTRVSAQGTIPLFEAAKATLGEIADQFLIVDQKSKTISINPAMVGTLTEISNKVIKVGGDLRDMAKPVVDVAIPILQGMASVTGFLADHVKAVGTGFATWYVLRSITGVYTEVIAATNGATTAQTLLGRAVQSVSLSYQERLAQVRVAAAEEMASTINVSRVIKASEAEKVTAKKLSSAVTLGVLKAEEAGNYILASQIRGLAKEYIDLGFTAEQAGAMQLQAAQAASRGNFLLATQIIATRDAHIASMVAAKQSEAAMVSGAGRSVGAVRGLLSTVWALAGGWIGVAGAIAYATYELVNYMNTKDKVDSYNPKAEVFERDGKAYKKRWSDEETTDVMTGEKVKGGWEFVELSPAELEAHNFYKENGYAPDWESKRPKFNFEAPDMSQLGVKFPGTDDGKAAKTAERAYEEAQRLNDKVADMMAKMNNGIAAVTSTVFEANTARLTEEIANMKRELDKSAIDFAKYGIDTTAVLAKIQEYQTTISAEHEKQRSRSMSGLLGDTGRTTAEISGDKAAQAEAEYQATLLRLEKEKEDKFKEVAKNKNDAEAKNAVDNWYTQQVLLAQKKRTDSQRDALLQEYDYHVQHNNMLYNLTNTSQTQIDAMNRRELNAKISYLDQELAHAKLTAEDRVKYEKQKNDAIQQLNDIARRNASDALKLYLKDAEKQGTDYYQLYDQSFNNIHNSIKQNLTDSLTFTQSFATGFKNIIRDMVQEATRMMVEMWYQQAVMQPVKKWWSGVIEGFLGGGSSSSDDSSSSSSSWSSSKQSIADNLLPKGFATGGRYPVGEDILVGEKGPEIVRFDKPGEIVPNHQLSSLGGAISNTFQLPFMPNININSSKANSPEEILEIIMKNWQALRGQIIDDLENNTAVRNGVKGAAGA